MVCRTWSSRKSRLRKSGEMVAIEMLVSSSRNKHIFRCDQNGSQARRSEPDWQLEGAYLNRYATEEQRGRRPIFITTLWAAASWLFFRVARSSRIDLDMLVARALKNSQRTGGESHAYFGDRTLVPRQYCSLVIDHGRAISAIGGHQPLTIGLNRRDLHDRFEEEIKANIENARRLKIPNLICFSGNRSHCLGCSGVSSRQFAACEVSILHLPNANNGRRYHPNHSLNKKLH